MELHYCWRCNSTLPFLDETEWTEISPNLPVSLITMMEAGKGNPALDIPAVKAFQELTGYTIGDRNAIYHHRRILYGHNCTVCGNLIRSPMASYCAHCSNVAN